MRKLKLLTNVYKIPCIYVYVKIGNISTEYGAREMNSDSGFHLGVRGRIL